MKIFLFILLHICCIFGSTDLQLIPISKHTGITVDSQLLRYEIGETFVSARHTYYISNTDSSKQVIFGMSINGREKNIKKYRKKGVLPGYEPITPYRNLSIKVNDKSIVFPISDTLFTYTGASSVIADSYFPIAVSNETTKLEISYQMTTGLGTVNDFSNIRLETWYVFIDHVIFKNNQYRCTVSVDSSLKKGRVDAVLYRGREFIRDTTAISGVQGSLLDYTNNSLCFSYTLSKQFVNKRGAVIEFDTTHYFTAYEQVMDLLIRIGRAENNGHLSKLIEYLRKTIKQDPYSELGKYSLLALMQIGDQMRYIATAYHPLKTTTIIKDDGTIREKKQKLPKAYYDWILQGLDTSSVSAEEKELFVGIDYETNSNAPLSRTYSDSAFHVFSEEMYSQQMEEKKKTVFTVFGILVMAVIGMAMRYWIKQR